MIGRKNRILLIAGAIVVAASIVGAIFYAYKKGADASLTNAEEVVLQQEIARIIESKTLADCTTISNTTYRKACEQALSAPVQRKGIPLQTNSAEPMTAAQLEQLAKNSLSQSGYNVQRATTTP
ncbi:MAG: hypothetical protein WCT41_03840 [Candidatus Paceibacterota bacterium]|jgi:hypothetical protein